jgi:hypothetical protein
MSTMKKLMIIITLASVLVTSCSEEFLELEPKDVLNGDNYYKTESQFEEALVGVYAKLQGQVGFYFELSEWRSDYLDLAAPTAGTQDRYNLNKFIDTPTNGLVEDAWANYYNGILRCNLLIENIGDATFDEVKKAQIEGEARFIRALTYFNIVRLWGAAPLILKSVSPEEALQIGRSPIESLYESIEADLDFAIENLSNTADLGRVKSNAAKALMGKVLLTQSKYAAAETVLKEVIGFYGLTNTIAEVFDPENESNSEIIFSIRFEASLIGEGHGYWFGVGDVTISPYTDKLETTFEPGDNRLSMVDYLLTSDNEYVPGKYFAARENNQTDNDFIVLRYADVLLMLSEAINAQGYQASGEAYTYLNEVRARAGLADLTSTQLSDQSTFKAAILLERFKEFPLEGHRWFDLVRFNAVNDEIVGNIIGVTSVPNFRLLYPVPNTEYEKMNNDEIFGQNEGY